MKIYFLINSPYPRYAGGIENWLYNVSERLSKEHEVTIIAHERKEYPVLYPDITCNNIFKFKTLRSFKILKPFIRSYLVLFDLFLGSYFMEKTLKNILPEDEKCYIIALDSMFCVKAGLIAKRNNNNAKLISSVRSTHAEIYGKKFPLFAKGLLKFEKKMLSSAHCVWANGYDTIDLLKSKGIESNLMRNGIDYYKLEKIQIDDDLFNSTIRNKISIVSVGTLLPIKGIYELIDSVSNLRNVYQKDAILIFIGKGNQKRYIEYAKNKGLEKHVYFLGHKKNPVAYVKKCSISACLSGGSGMSMSAIECMVSGTPIVAWDTPVYQQFNKNIKTMKLVEINNIPALDNAFLEVVDKYEEFQNIANNAFVEASGFDWKIICDELVANLNLC